MPRPPAAGTKRNRVLAAGRRLYEEGGCAAISVRRVAEAAGANPAMVHYHFGSRDGFVRALLQTVYDAMFADLSLVAYLYYPAEEFGFDIAAQHKNIAVWLDRVKALPGWKHPYDLMPGHPLPGR